jgi:hypothetical protein
MGGGFSHVLGVRCSLKKRPANLRLVSIKGTGKFTEMKPPAVGWRARGAGWPVGFVFSQVSSARPGAHLCVRVRSS